MFKKGYSTELDFEHMHKYCNADNPTKVSERLEANWEEELKNPKKANVVRALAKTFGLRYSIYACICLLTVSQSLFSAGQSKLNQLN